MTSPSSGGLEEVLQVPGEPVEFQTTTTSPGRSWSNRRHSFWAIPPAARLHGMAMRASDRPGDKRFEVRGEGTYS